MNPEIKAPERKRQPLLRQLLGRRGLSDERVEAPVENGYVIISDEDGQPKYEAHVLHATSDMNKAVGSMLPSNDGDFLLGTSAPMGAEVGIDTIGDYQERGFAPVIHRYVEARASISPTGEPYIAHHGYVVEEKVDQHGYSSFSATEYPLINDMLRFRHGAIPVRRGSTWVYGRPLLPENDVPSSAITEPSLKYGQTISEVKAAVQKLSSSNKAA